MHLMWNNTPTKREQLGEQRLFLDLSLLWYLTSEPWAQEAEQIWEPGPEEQMEEEDLFSQCLFLCHNFQLTYLTLDLFSRRAQKNHSGLPELELEMSSWVQLQVKQNVLAIYPGWKEHQWDQSRWQESWDWLGKRAIQTNGPRHFHPTSEHAQLWGLFATFWLKRACFFSFFLFWGVTKVYPNIFHIDFSPQSLIWKIKAHSLWMGIISLSEISGVQFGFYNKVSILKYCCIQALLGTVTRFSLCIFTWHEWKGWSVDIWGWHLLAASLGEELFRQAEKQSFGPKSRPTSMTILWVGLCQLISRNFLFSFIRFSSERALEKATHILWFSLEIKKQILVAHIH